MTLAIKVFGVQDMIRAFGEIPRAVGNMNMRKAMNAGAGIIRDAAASRVPRDTGLLKKSLKIKVRVPDASFNKAHHGRPAYAVIGPSRYVIGATRRTAAGKVRAMSDKKALKTVLGGGRVKTRAPYRYAHLVERGTKGHTINVKNRRVLSSGTATFGRRAQHPGTKARSFLAAAVRASGGAAQAKVLDKLQECLSEWAAKRALSIKSPWGRGLAAIAG